MWQPDGNRYKVYVLKHYNSVILKAVIMKKSEPLRVSDSKNGARLEWWIKDLYNDSYHWIRIHYQITKIILFF